MILQISEVATLIQVIYSSNCPITEVENTQIKMEIFFFHRLIFCALQVRLTVVKDVMPNCLVTSFSLSRSSLTVR